MPSEPHAKSSRRRPQRPPVTGLIVLVVVGGAVALPVLMDGGCTPRVGGSAASGTEPMELWGRWLGMMLASADSATARTLGVPAVMTGVVVADVARDGSSRAAHAGLLPGDVIVKVDGTSTGNLADLYTLTTRLNTARAVSVEIVRQGQPMMVAVPPPFEAMTQAPIALQTQQAPPWNPAAPPAPLPQAIPTPPLVTAPPAPNPQAAWAMPAQPPTNVP
jgi:membrane-associated protease RseP (regulator of RpoE activity)